MKYTITIIPLKNGKYLGILPEIPDYQSEKDTPQEVLKDMEDYCKNNNLPEPTLITKEEFMLTLKAVNPLLKLLESDIINKVSK